MALVGNPLSLKVLNTLNPIAEVDIGCWFHHQFFREIIAAFLAHGRQVKPLDIVIILGTFEVDGILVFAAYDYVGASISNMFTDTPDRDLPVFFAYSFFGYDTPCLTDRFIDAGSFFEQMINQQSQFPLL